MMFGEMLNRGVGVGNATLGDLIYWLLARKRVREGYKVLQWVKKPEISVYDGLM